jgi:hypothetical protein
MANARFERGHIRADRHHLAHRFRAQIDGRLRAGGIQSGGDIGIGGIDPGIQVADDDLFRFRLRERRLHNFGGGAKVAGEPGGDQFTVSGRKGHRKTP